MIAGFSIAGASVAGLPSFSTPVPGHGQGGDHMTFGVSRGGDYVTDGTYSRGGDHGDGASRGGDFQTGGS